MNLARVLVEQMRDKVNGPVRLLRAALSRFAVIAKHIRLVSNTTFVCNFFFLIFDLDPPEDRNIIILLFGHCQTYQVSEERNLCLQFFFLIFDLDPPEDRNIIILIFGHCETYQVSEEQNLCLQFFLSNF